MKSILKNNYLSLFLFVFSFQWITAQTAPIATNNTDLTNQGVTLTVNLPGVLQNDIDTDGDTLIITEYFINGTTYMVGQTATITEGEFLLNADGSYSLIPATDFYGVLPAITHTVSDGTLTDTADLIITVQMTNNFAPTTADDYDTVEINTTLTVPVPGVLVNDTDDDGNPLSVLTFTINGTQYNVGDTANTVNARITLNADGSYEIIPTTGFTGELPDIFYTITDGTFTSEARLRLTVEEITNLIDIITLGSCNQGYTPNGEYKIIYSLQINNRSTARDYHATNLIKNINLTNDLAAIYGTGCVTSIDDMRISTIPAFDYVNNPYPEEFTDAAINPDYLTASSNNLLTNNATTNFTLFPRQSIQIQYCITINPFCNGRPNPTPAGAGINFDNIINVTSSIGNSTNHVNLTDFHTSEAVVSGGFFVPETNPIVNSNGTHDYTNTVILTNEGTSTANNINYNMGLGKFLNNRINFTQITINQTSGPTVTINTSFDGDTNTLLLNPNNSLAAGETVILEVFHLIAPITSTGINLFNQNPVSQTQGNIDGFDETTTSNKREYSFVVWEDALGKHLDQYYPVLTATQTASSNNQCNCDASFMFFDFTAASSNTKIISAVDEAPAGILEHQKTTFRLTATNTSSIVELTNLQLQDNLNNVCVGNIVSISTPIIQNSTAATNPTLNTNYNGVSDTNLFDGTSGLLLQGQSITIEFSVVFSEDCFGVNTSNFLATDPINRSVTSFGNVSVNASTDTDGDGITNLNDIDDDNDTIPDILEYNGLNPLDDADSDFIPNYRDPDYGSDANADGIIDVFDFDNDGVPNHFDLDSDNDGILDIREAGNTSEDTNNNGRTNNAVGLNGLRNTLENNDSLTANINYTLPNSDGDGNLNYLDIDSDGDGIVDNIEAQLTASYLAPNNIVNTTGIDTAYPNGLIPIDTENDGIFDYIDTNSDNDLWDDPAEGWDTNGDGIANTIPSNSDSDTDGLDDSYDQNDNLVNPTNGQTPLNFPNIDNPDNPERDWRELIAIIVLIDNITVVEGNNLNFNITLVKKNNNSILIQSTTPVDLDITTTDGTTSAGTYNVATAPFDYTPANITITFPPFTDSMQLTVSSLDDPIYEQQEVFTVNGSITSNNTVTSSIKGTGTINDDEPKPSISMNNSMENEGVALSHTITISHPSSTPIELGIATSNNQAISPDDYTGTTQKITINGTIDSANANTQISFSIPTILDNLNELNQEIFNVLGTVTSTNISTQDLDKTGTIIDIDPFPVLGINNQTVVEGNLLTFTISLLNANGDAMRNYLPIDTNVATFESTARFDDFTSVDTNISIPALDTSIIQTVLTTNDKLNEDTETMGLRATINSSNLSEISSADGIGTIKDDDFPNLFSPNDDGKSDVFWIRGIKDFPNFSITILDRWGSEVFNYSNNGNTTPLWWDGTNNGNPVPEGVYFYTLNFNDGTTKPKVSFIQLVR